MIALAGLPVFAEATQNLKCSGTVSDGDGYSIGKKSFEVRIDGEKVGVKGLGGMYEDRVRSAERNEGRLEIKGSNSSYPFSIAIPLKGLKKKARFSGTTLVMHTGGGDYVGRFLCKL